MRASFVIEQKNGTVYNAEVKEAKNTEHKNEKRGCVWLSCLCMSFPLSFALGKVLLSFVVF